MPPITKTFTNKTDLLQDLGMVLYTNPNFQGNYQAYNTGVYKDLNLNNISFIVAPYTLVTFYNDNLATQDKALVRVPVQDIDGKTNYSDFTVVKHYISGLCSPRNQCAVTRIEVTAMDPVAKLELIKNAGSLIFTKTNLKGDHRIYNTGISALPVQSDFSILLFPNTKIELYNDKTLVTSYENKDNRFTVIPDPNPSITNADGSKTFKPMTSVTITEIEPSIKSYTIEGFSLNLYNSNSCAKLATNIILNIILIAFIAYMVHMIWSEIYGVSLTKK